VFLLIVFPNKHRVGHKESAILSQIYLFYLLFHTDGQKVKKSKKSTIFELEQNKEKNARFTLR